MIDENENENELPTFVRLALSPAVSHQLDLEVEIMLREVDPRLLDGDVEVLLRILDYERGHI